LTETVHFAPVGDLSIPSNDETLIKYFLLHFFKIALDIKPFQLYLADEYLNPLFAEAKLV
jgi:hypothetical protein